MNIFTNLSIMLARLYEYKKSDSDAVRVCDILLSKQLPSHLKKTFDSIKARVTKQVSQPSTGGGGGKPAGKGKGAQEATPAIEVSKADQMASEVLGYLELIKNGNKDVV